MLTKDVKQACSSSTLVNDVHHADGPAAMPPDKLPDHAKTLSRKTYQRGSRGWRACPW
jgi:hypothetical protein